MDMRLAKRRPPWKVLTDEVLPIVDFLGARGQTKGPIRFLQDSKPYDPWIATDGGIPRRVEVTGALSRAQVALAKAERERKVKAGFLGLPDDADGKVYAQALKRPRVMHSRRCVETQVEAGLLASLAKKNKPGKYSGGVLMIAEPLMRLQDDRPNGYTTRLPLCPSRRFKRSMIARSRLAYLSLK